MCATAAERRAGFACAQSFFKCTMASNYLDARASLFFHHVENNESRLEIAHINNSLRACTVVLRVSAYFCFNCKGQEQKHRIAKHLFLNVMDALTSLLIASR